MIISPVLSSLIGNPVIGPSMSFLLGVSKLIKYLEINYPKFVFEAFENEPELFNLNIIN